MSILSKPYFHDEAAAFEYLESVLWPNGPVCPHCEGKERIYKIAPNPEKRVRQGLHKCGHCRKQFTVRVGTVFEASKVELHKWLQAVYLMSASKKGVSAHQLHRILEVTYKTAWFMAHRIRIIDLASARAAKIPDLGVFRVIYGEQSIEIDKSLHDKALAFRTRQEADAEAPWRKGISRGNIFGELRGVMDFEGEREFFIVPPSGPQKIQCIFPESLRDKMNENLFQVVRASGFLHFDGSSPHPFLLEADELEGVEEPKGHFSDLRGLFEKEETPPADEEWA